MNQIVLVLRTVSVVDTVTPPTVKHPSVPTALRAGWDPHATTPACTGGQKAKFASVILVMRTAVVNWNVPGGENV